MVFHRLEAVAHTVDKGEWPTSRRTYTPLHELMSDSQSSTPLGGTPSGTPRVESGVHDYNLLSSADGMVRVQQVKQQYGFTESEAEDYVAGYYGDQYDHGDDPYERERDFRVALMEVGRSMCIGQGRLWLAFLFLVPPQCPAVNVDAMRNGWSGCRI